MLSNSNLEAIGSYLPSDCIRKNEDLSKYCTFRIGGPAAFLLEPQNEEQLSKVIRYLNLVDQPYFILGNGSNTLVRDVGYDGVVIHLGKQMNQIRVEGNRIYAGAGASLPLVSMTAAKHGLSGLEFSAGIPGSVGGGVVMNAGAYDGEMSNCVVLVKVITKDGEILELSNENMEFGYRHSTIRNHPFIVSEVVFELAPGNQEEILAKMEDFNNRRREKQPLEYPSAGSTFKRPQNGYAGEMIMNAGLRGFQIGGARVSDKHCGFVINTGNASSEDVLDLIAEIQDRVKSRFGVELEPEIVVLGD